MFLSRDELMARLANLEYEIAALTDMIEHCDSKLEQWQLMTEREELYVHYDHVVADLQDEYELEVE